MCFWISGLPSRRGQTPPHHIRTIPHILGNDYRQSGSYAPAIAQTATMITRLLPATIAASTLVAAAIGSFASPAHADPGCQTDPWGFGGSQRRTLCDGPISSDGSWSRERTIWAPAHYVPDSCPGGSSSSHTFCSGGYSVPEHVVSNETYPVRPDTVLPDEPGHLG
jgi:hypothetical protein